MPVHNAEIARLFERLADLLEIEGANSFRVRAYRNAARVLSGLSRPVADLRAEGADLTELPGIGEDLADKIAAILDTGELAELAEVEQRVPAKLADLTRIDGLGPKRVRALYQQLNIRGAGDLQRALDAGRIRQLSGFGAKTEAKIREGLAKLATAERRTGLLEAEAIAEPLVAHLQKAAGVTRITIAGSYRRRKETVGDLDILVTCADSEPVMERLTDYDQVAEVVSHGSTRATVVLRSGMQVDLRVVPEASYGAALQYFTGAKAHNVATRRIAVDMGLKSNEYGLFRGDERIAGATEEELYAALGLAYIEPELREHRGEIEAAREGRLPELIDEGDVRGDLHCHSRATDGRDSIERMARAAAARGYEYLAITDHSRRVAMAHGLDTARLREQLAEVDRVNDTVDGVTVLKAIEVDILEDGSLDLPDAVLAELDLTVCAVHYGRGLSRKRQTERIIRAMDNPRFNILAHPSGRLINEREPYAVDLERLMAAAAERGCVLEQNAQPERLDLTDVQCRMARDMGVKLAISTDAHAADQLGYMRFGVAQGRRGWLRTGDVINTRGLGDLRKALRRP